MGCARTAGPSTRAEALGRDDNLISFSAAHHVLGYDCAALRAFVCLLRARSIFRRTSMGCARTAGPSTRAEALGRDDNLISFSAAHHVLGYDCAALRAFVCLLRARSIFRRTSMGCARTAGPSTRAEALGRDATSFHSPRPITSG